MKAKLITIDYEEYKELVSYRNKAILVGLREKNKLLDDLKRFIQENSEENVITFQELDRYIFSMKQGIMLCSIKVEKEIIELEGENNK